MSGLTQPMYNILLLACKRNERERSFVRPFCSVTVNLPALFYHCNAHTTRRGGGGVYDMRQRFLLYLLEPSEMSGRVTICGGDGDGGREGGTYTEAEGGATRRQRSYFLNTVRLSRTRPPRTASSPSKCRCWPLPRKAGPQRHGKGEGKRAQATAAPASGDYKR